MDTSGYHIDSVARIRDALIDSYTVDFPDAYEDLRHETREAMREVWMNAYLGKLSDLLETDFKKNGAESFVSRFDRTHKSTECLVVLEEIKEALYPTYLKHDVTEQSEKERFSP